MGESQTFLKMDYDWYSSEAVIRIIKGKVLTSLSDIQPTLLYG